MNNVITETLLVGGAKVWLFQGARYASITAAWSARAEYERTALPSRVAPDYSITRRSGSHQGGAYVVYCFRGVDFASETDAHAARGAALRAEVASSADGITEETIRDRTYWRYGVHLFRNIELAAARRWAVNNMPATAADAIVEVWSRHGVIGWLWGNETFVTRASAERAQEYARLTSKHGAAVGRPAEKTFTPTETTEPEEDHSAWRRFPHLAAARDESLRIGDKHILKAEISDEMLFFYRGAAFETMQEAQVIRELALGLTTKPKPDWNGDPRTFLQDITNALNNKPMPTPEQVEGEKRAKAIRKKFVDAMVAFEQRHVAEINAIHADYARKEEERIAREKGTIQQAGRRKIQL